VELEVALIEAAEEQRSEEDGPYPVVDLLHSHVLLGEHLAHVDPATSPAYPTIPTDQAPLEVRRVQELGYLARVGPERRLVDGGRRLLVQGFVRPRVVELLAEAIEDALLGGMARGRRASRVGLEGLVEALVSSVLLRMAGQDELWVDPTA